MIARFNIWLEADGGIVLSPWRARLLASIERAGSISAAAEELGIPYRRAWEKLREMETNYGRSLVETEVGGARGGGAHLTGEARDLMKRFERFEAGLQEEIEARYQRAFEAS